MDTNNTIDRRVTGTPDVFDFLNFESYVNTSVLDSLRFHYYLTLICAFFRFRWLPIVIGSKSILNPKERNTCIPLNKSTVCYK